MDIDAHGLVNLSVEDVLGHMIAVLGMTGSGKSNTVAVLVEELLAAGVPVVIVDTAGEYYGLKERFDILEIGKSRRPERSVDAEISPEGASHAARTAYLAAQSVILNISGFDQTSRDYFVATYMRQLWDIAPYYKYPHMIVLEEAHHFIPQRGRVPASEVMVKIAAEGRKEGLNIIASSQRSSRLDKDVVTQACKLAFLHQVAHPADLDVYYGIVPLPRQRVKDAVARLKVGEALLLANGEAQRRVIRKRHTPHGGHTPTLANLPKKRGVASAQEFVQSVLPLLLPKKDDKS